MKKIQFLLSILIFFLFLNCTQADEPISINILEKEKIQIIKYDGSHYLDGNIEITVLNNTDTTISLLDIGEHNFLFVDIEDTLKQYIPFHSCRAVQFYQNKHYEYINIEPKDQEVFYHNIWECDGGSFNIPPAGKYKLYFRTFEKNLYNKKVHVLRKIFIPGKNIPDQIKIVENELNSEMFWEGAIKSDPIIIEIKFKNQ